MHLIEFKKISFYRFKMSSLVKPPARLTFVNLTCELAFELRNEVNHPVIAASYDLRCDVDSSKSLFEIGENTDANLRHKIGLTQAALISSCDPKVDPTLVGAFTLNYGMLSYLVMRPYWGKGYGGEIARNACDMAFYRLGIQRLEALVLNTNVPSRRILDAIGFQLIGTTKINLQGYSHPKIALNYRLEKFYYQNQNL